MSDENRAWYRRHHLLIAFLGLSKIEAFRYRPEIEALASDIAVWRKRALTWLGAAVLLLVLVAIAHAYWVHTTTKLLYLVAYYIGLVGTAFAAYGFTLHPRGITARRESKLHSFPTPPRSAEHRDIFHYTDQLTRFFAGYFEEVEEGQWRQARIEIRRQLSLAGGMILIAFGFLIQIGLQFC